MKILHVTPYFAPAYVYGGPPRSVLGLCRALVRAGAEVTVLTTNANGDGDLAVATDAVTEFDGVAVRYLRRGFPRRYFGARGFAAAASALLTGAPAVHLHGCWNVLTWRAAAACRRAGVPYIVSTRGMLTPWSLEHSGLKKTIALALVERRVLMGAAAIHATSAGEQRAIESFDISRPIVVVPNGIEPPPALPRTADPVRWFAERWGLTGGDIVVLYLGRIHEKKGIDVLAEAIRDVRTRDRRVKLVVAGEGGRGYEDALRLRFADLLAARALVFTGLLGGDGRAAAFAAADLFALTSHSENFALAVGEAMAAGLPVVVTRECPWPQIDQWNAGRWVPNDVAAIAAAIEALAADPGLRRMLGENGRRGVSATLTWDGVALTMLDLYTRSVARGRAVLDPAASRA